MPISLHHAQVFYPPGEEAKARDFYCGVREAHTPSSRGRRRPPEYGKRLGLREIERPSTLSERAGLWYEAPPGHVHLSADHDLGLHPRRHFALRVDDLDTLRNRLRRRCYCGVREAHTPSRRRRRRPPEYVFDPFGNKIELDEIP